MLGAKSRDARIKAATSLLERIPIFMTLVGHIAFSLRHLLQKKRLFLSEIGVYLSRTLTVEGFWAYGRLATAPVIPDQHGGYYPPTPLRLGYRRRYQKYRANRHFRKPNWIPSKKGWISHNCLLPLTILDRVRI